LSQVTPRPAITKYFINLAAGVGGALYQHYARRQFLLYLRELDKLPDETLFDIGIRREDLLEAEAQIRRGEIPEFPPKNPR
jgi:uncharacterized protein YjiS (DUF1127 family)